MKTFWKKIKGWLCGWKFWVTLLIVIVCTVLFGSFAANFGGILFGWLSTFIGWIGAALKWLAGVINFFGWNGML